MINLCVLIKKEKQPTNQNRYINFDKPTDEAFQYQWDCFCNYVILDIA